jgi:hypothetical protein
LRYVSKMKLYYAMGGGLGHLTRARAFFFNLGIDNDSAIILTSSPFASDKRVVGDFKTIQVDKSYENDVPAFQKYLQNILSGSNIDSLYIDSFPLGIIGEFADFNFPENLEINYIARLLKWKNYSHFLENKILHFNKTFILEPLENEHQNFIDENSGEQIETELKYPEPVLNTADEEIFRFIVNEKKPFWLVVHSGSEAETTELINFAAEMREIEKADVNLILISPNNLSFYLHPFSQFDLYPASVLFNDAERIFTACGFNAMRQMAKFRFKHYLIPFERRYDDQFARARRFR